MKFNKIIVIALILPVILWACGKSKPENTPDSLMVDSAPSPVSKDEPDALKEKPKTDTNFYIIDIAELQENYLYKLKGLKVYDQKESADHYLSVDFVTEEDYLAHKAKAKSFVVKDSVGVERNKDELRLHLTHGVKVFKNHYAPDIADYDSSFYCNQCIPELNCYLVSGHYWEDHDFRLVDKSSGIELAVLNHLPLLSPDHKWIASLEHDPYGGGTYVEVYSNDNRMLQQVFEVQFPNWLVSHEEGENFWIDSHTLYMKISPPSDYRDSDSEQYAKIVLK